MVDNAAHGFLDTGGSFTAIDFPGATGGTAANGINDAGEIVGNFSDGTGGHGFVDAGGVFTAIDLAGAMETSVTGINDAGQIVGFYLDPNGIHGFIAAIPAVPEPASFALLGIGFIGVCVMRRWRRPSTDG